jgi:predicted permease
MPPGFFGTTVGQCPDLWIPLSMEAQIFPGWNGLDRELFQSLYFIGRLKPGVDLRAAGADVNLVFKQTLRGYAGSEPGADQLTKIEHARIDLTPVATGMSQLRSQFSKPLQILSGVVGLVLLIGCANLANLMLARGTARTREMAVRMAVGAGRARVIRQLMTENLLLALLGGALGVIFATWTSRWLVLMVSAGSHPLPLDVAPDARVLGFTLILSIATAVFFGSAPAVDATRLSFADALKECRGMTRSGRRSMLARALIVTQLTMSLVLLAGAGLFLRSLSNLASIPTGFDRYNALLFRIDEGSVGYKEDLRLANLYRQIEERVGTVPGVRAAAFSFFTFHQGAWTTRISTPATASQTKTGPTVSHNVVGPGYFAAMGIPFVQGRGFTTQDTDQSIKVAVVNETLAREFFADQNPIGQRFRIGNEPSDQNGYVEIVGLVKDAKYETLREKARPAAFYPYSQHLQYLENFVVRFAGDPRGVIPGIRNAIHAVDPNLPLSELTTLAAEVDRSIVDQRLLARLSTGFGVLATFLACLGIYGVMSYTVNRRTTELGIRMALGARRRGVLWLILQETLVLAGIGTLIGLPLMLAVQQLIANQLYGLPSIDLAPGLTAAVLMTLVAALAGYLPANRAAKVDPMVALRCE